MNKSSQLHEHSLRPRGWWGQGIALLAFAAGVFLTPGIVLPEEAPEEPAAYATPAQFKTAEDVLRFIADNKDKSGIVWFVQGTDNAVLSHNPRELFPLASTIKILYLIEMAEQSVAGTLDVEDSVLLADLDRYYLPRADGGAHPRSLAYFDEARIGQFGGPRQVQWRDVAIVMIMFSSNAATDMIGERIGMENIAARAKILGLVHHDAPVSLGGLSLLWHNQEQDPAVRMEYMKELLALDRDVVATRANELGARYASDATFREAWRQWAGARNDPFGSLPEQFQLVSATVPRSTPEDYARLMLAIATGEGMSISEGARGIAGHVLYHTMDTSRNEEHFATCGFKGGSLLGTLTGAWYYVPRDTGADAVPPSAGAIFFRDLPFDQWLALQRSSGFAELSFRLASEKGFLDRARVLLEE